MILSILYKNVYLFVILLSYDTKCQLSKHNVIFIKYAELKLDEWFYAFDQFSDYFVPIKVYDITKCII